MAVQDALLFFLAVLAVFLVCTSDAAIPPNDIKHTSFPPGFIFGAGSSAYQYEGATSKDGRRPSIWDTFVKTQPGKIDNKSPGHLLEINRGDIEAQDFYGRYKEDIQLMKKIGLKSFRFSISWSRILPYGTVHGGVNLLGVQFYNNLINELKANEIEPFVTLFHFDPPQALEDEYGGLRSPMIVDDFRDYTDFCFKTFGDRVKFWATLNEPNGFSDQGYNSGVSAPGRCSNYLGNCPTGDSATEPYIVAHHLLLCHTASVKLYRQKYKPYQKGQIGITVASYWYVPKYDTRESYDAADRAFDFSFGWFVNPITFGEYPEVMRRIIGNRLPNFTEEESKMIKESYDFLGVNYYSGRYAENGPLPTGFNLSYTTDRQVTISAYKGGQPIGKPTDLSWLYVYPEGFYLYLLSIKKKYNDPIIYVTENGMADKGSLTLKDGLNDTLRISYHRSHLEYLLKAITEGVKVKAYYVWTLMDDFEWGSGFNIRFGFTYIDYNNNLTRHLKDSAFWFKSFIFNNTNAASKKDEKYSSSMKKIEL